MCRHECRHARGHALGTCCALSEKNVGYFEYPQIDTRAAAVGDADTELVGGKDEVCLLSSWGTVC